MWNTQLKHLLSMVAVAAAGSSNSAVQTDSQIGEANSRKGCYPEIENSSRIPGPSKEPPQAVIDRSTSPKQPMQYQKKRGAVTDIACDINKTLCVLNVPAHIRIQ